MNKYQSDTLCVKKSQICGWLRRTVQQVKLFQKSLFPLRFFVINKASKRMYVFDRPSGTLKQDLSLEGLRCAVQLDHSPNLQPDTAMQQAQFGVTHCLPQDFQEPFALFLKEQVMLLWAKDSKEQTIWR